MSVSSGPLVPCVEDGLTRSGEWTLDSLKQTRDQVQVSTTTVQWGHYKVQVPGVNNISDNTRYTCQRCHQQDQGSGTSVQCQKQWGHHVGIITTTSSSLPGKFC